MQIEVGEFPTQVRLTCELIGEDLLISLSGGEKPHIGAIAIAIPRPSLADPEKISATVSVHTILGHKEDELAKKTAHQIAAYTNRVVTLTAGLHIGNANKEQIEKLLENSYAAVAALLNDL